MNEIFNAEVVAEGYGKRPLHLDEVERAVARDELKALLQSVIDVVEWREDPTDEKKGEALLQLFPVPGLWVGDQRDSRFVTLSNMVPHPVGCTNRVLRRARRCSTRSRPK